MVAIETADEDLFRLATTGVLRDEQARHHAQQVLCALYGAKVAVKRTDGLRQRDITAGRNRDLPQVNGPVRQHDVERSVRGQFQGSAPVVCGP